MIHQFNYYLSVNLYDMWIWSTTVTPVVNSVDCTEPLRMENRQLMEEFSRYTTGRQGARLIWGRFEVWNEINRGGGIIKAGRHGNQTSPTNVQLRVK